MKDKTNQSLTIIHCSLLIAYYYFKLREVEHMVLVRAIIRTHKVGEVLSELLSAGFPAVTKMDVFGRGKQKGVKVGEVYYDEIPKEMIMIVVEDQDEAKVEKIIADAARTPNGGTYGDGKIFVMEVEKAVTISSGKEEL